MSEPTETVTPASNPEHKDVAENMLGSRVLKLITDERVRQVEELGYTTERDKEYVANELADAAASYLLAWRAEAGIPKTWPWEEAFWKPSPENRVRELVKAGALVVAEIERLLNNNDEKASSE